VERLSRLQYRAHWEAGAEGPHVIFGHCPYAAVIERHPELCQMDGKAIAAVMKAEVQQKAKIAQSGPGASSCVFALKYL
jgi:predicted ArsR family transcriptional regulator